MERLLFNISTLYRGINKYLDKKLKPYGLGSGQFLFIIMINESEGISMNEIINSSSFDKGTVSKTFQKLEEENYIYYKVDENDKRVKKIYTTEKTNSIINELYQIRKELYEHLVNGIEDSDATKNVNDLANNSLEFFVEKEESIKIGGFQKLSLVDYPNKVASTIFTSGCNFKCPYCHNKDLVFVPSNIKYYDIDEVRKHLIKRKNILKGIVISGGEPLLHEGLLDFITIIKNIGFDIKLDTNGYYPEHLKELLDTNMIDYVAMDIKNTKDKYPMTVGLAPENLDINKIEQSINIIMNSNIDYEFRTTIINEFHTREDMVEIAQWIKGAKSYYLQPYRESENVINPCYTTPSEEYMEELKNIAITYIDNTYIRGGN